MPGDLLIFGPWNLIDMRPVKLRVGQFFRQVGWWRGQFWHTHAYTVYEGILQKPTALSFFLLKCCEVYEENAHVVCY